MGLKNIIKKTGKYVIKKISRTVVGRGVKWAFWGLICFYGPGPVVAAVGINGLLVGAAVAHSGIVEYSAEKMIDKTIDDD